MRPIHDRHLCSAFPAAQFTQILDTVDVSWCAVAPQAHQDHRPREARPGRWL